MENCRLMEKISPVRLKLRPELDQSRLVKMERILPSGLKTWKAYVLPVELLRSFQLHALVQQFGLHVRVRL